MPKLKGVFTQDKHRVWLDGKELKPYASQKVWNHSPDGFAWGYAGSGPAQLALAILLECGFSKEEAVWAHQGFKRKVICDLLPFGKDFEIEFELPAKEQP